ncbi:SDR family oxidoreductase [Pseudomonas sp. BN102]|uniref:SDR family oxidoreductase n=1 Tax=Pseudomonas sp. BN102 TaxID=2567886 RepID=UPI0024547A5F|nr:SDR family oxidoreductase [Pseudomonas sp. BN102]MDH4608063.1 SDR family oxidoreductase [Pseudomonas sp. BN102]
MTNVVPNGKVAIVTGASSGIGRVTARELALQGYRVFLACRSAERTKPVLEEISRVSAGTAKVAYIPLDLADLDSVRRCAEAFLKLRLPLHLLVGNAGLAGQRGLTRSGFELAFGTCHVGHFLQVQLLLERLKESAPARVVMVSSKAHRHAQTIDMTAVRQPTSSRTGIKEYAVAKLANLLFTKELARQLEGSGVTTYAVHPGVVATDVWRTLPGPAAWLLKKFMRSEAEGAATTLFCATTPALSTQSGLYYADCAEAEASPTAQDMALAAELWRLSQEWVAGR